ncbi:MAG: GT4 family glycosyltransferase PelF [Candidatus Muirbacterium halophilum]|nr:GT4 family glycosyltransferase PelF [Candidatus Muirbacterium halophilum]
MGIIKSNVCIISEGSYPYVRGGVGDWIHKIISNMPDISFSVFFIGSKKEDCLNKNYDFPKNLIEYKELFLFDKNLKADNKKIPLEFFIKTHDLMENILNKENFNNKLEEWLKYFIKISPNNENIFNSKYFYSMVVDLAKKYADDNSFMDLYWNVGFICEPFLKIMSFIKKIPQSEIYHSVSTGYAGFAGSVVSIIREKPFILTEHGIYTRERKIDINQSEWIFSDKVNSIFEIDKAVFFKKLWIGFFIILSKIAYNYSKNIFSITRGNMLTQKNEGALIEKLLIIPNGIEIEKFAPCIKNRDSIKKIALIGRVVPVKDILTFIKVAFSVLSKHPDIKFEIVGPFEEDIDYYNICKDFVKILKIEDKVQFTGRVDLSKKLYEIDLLILTSISEGLPLVILEGFSSKIPAICTNVGGCSDVILGNPEFENDINIGNAGEISPVMDINSLSLNIIKLIEDKKLYKKYQDNAFERVNKFYNLKKVTEQYRSYYKKWLE